MSRRREIYGRVYELFTTSIELDGPHPYVGKTWQTIHERVNVGPRAHKSPSSIRRSPWKARIREGAAGYRLLEVVYATGDQRADEAQLRRAEAFWIDRLRPTYNEVRPVRPPVHESGPRLVRPKASPRTRQARARAGWSGQGRQVRERTAFWMTTGLVSSVMLWLLLPMPWPVAIYPWLLAPCLGFIATVLLERKLTTRPRRRRRSSRVR